MSRKPVMLLALILAAFLSLALTPQQADANWWYWPNQSSGTYLQYPTANTYYTAPYMTYTTYTEPTTYYFVSTYYIPSSAARAAAARASYARPASYYGPSIYGPELPAPGTRVREP